MGPLKCSKAWCIAYAVLGVAGLAATIGLIIAAIYSLWPVGVIVITVSGLTWLIRACGVLALFSVDLYYACGCKSKIFG